ncbi:MAG: HEPN domain-containing protein, partial [Acidobacteriota bacterium]|nr:HEPN domain-containing protein [Acidobacteriota bacterium]
TSCWVRIFTDDAARAAYLAAFHAAQALIFERTGKVAKTHRGVQNEFLRLTKDDPSFAPDQRIFLSQAYNFKALADYETGPAELSSEQVTAALERGRGFVDAVRRVLTPPKPV